MMPSNFILVGVTTIKRLRQLKACGLTVHYQVLLIIYIYLYSKDAIRELSSSNRSSCLDAFNCWRT